MSKSKMPASGLIEDAIIQVLRNAKKPLQVKELDSLVIKALNIDSETAAIIRSGNRTEAQYRFAWARTKLKKKNLIERESSSTWKVSE